MKAVALISGGKDSIYACLCIRDTIEVVALATLYPIQNQNHDDHSHSAAITTASVTDGVSLSRSRTATATETDATPGAASTAPLLDDVDSHMFQTVGYSTVQLFGKCMQLPLYRYPLRGHSSCTTLNYTKTMDDEVEDLYNLLIEVLKHHPDIKGVVSGAILSNYQRLRVEHVCSRLGLTSIAPLWQRNQRILLMEMIESNIDARIIKVAAEGLDSTMIGKSIRELQPILFHLEDRIGLNVCGEGGEFESLVVDCPLFTYRIEITQATIIAETSAIAASALLRIEDAILVEKDGFDLGSMPKGKELRQNVENTPQTIVHAATSSDTSSFSPASSPPLEIGDTSSRSRIRIVDDLAFVSTRYPANESENSVTNVFTEMLTILKANSFSIEDVLYVHFFIPNMSLFTTYNKEYESNIVSLQSPSRACIELPTHWILADFIAYRGRRDTLHVKSISTWAPACIGPYSQASTVNYLVFLAGQIGLDPMSMTLLPRWDEEVVQCWKNCEQVLRVCNTNLESTLSCLIFVGENTLGKIPLDTTDSPLHRNSCHQISNISSNYLKRLPHLPPFIFVPCLPRSATIEIQLTSFQRFISQSFKPTFKCIERNLDSWNLSARMTFVSECFVSIQMSVTNLRTQPLEDGLNLDHMNMCIHALLELTERALSDAMIPPSNIWQCRIFHIHSLSSSNLNSVFSQALMSHSVFPTDFAISFLPVSQIIQGEASSSMHMHLVAWDVEEMNA